ncbi:MAG: hypothetical protein HFI50_10120 [Lachnospiraceae bacterium]|nr:hypothetical protein [Lachnospiraceae bacterium]
MRISYEVSRAAFVSVLLFLAGIFCIVKGGGIICAVIMLLLCRNCKEQRFGKAVMPRGK